MPVVNQAQSLRGLRLFTFRAIDISFIRVYSLDIDPQGPISHFVSTHVGKATELDHLQEEVVHNHQQHNNVNPTDRQEHPAIGDANGIMEVASRVLAVTKAVQAQEQQTQL